MIVGLYILAAIIGVGLLLKLTDRPTPESGGTVGVAVEPQSRHGEICCGRHDVCEKGGASDKIEYFDDEELDAFAGKGAGSYTSEEIEQFRDVLLTLSAEEVEAWGRSISLRGIELPEEVRDEYLMLAEEGRRVFG